METPEDDMWNAYMDLYDDVVVYGGEKWQVIR